MGLAVAVAKIFDLIFLVLFVTVLLTWFPGINWQQEPFRAMRNFSEIFFAPFGRIIPPLGMIDISPIIAFICLSIVRNILINLLIRMGL